VTDTNLETVPNEIKAAIVRGLIVELARIQYGLQIQGRVYNGIEPGGKTVQDITAQMAKNEKVLDAYRAELAILIMEAPNAPQPPA